MPRFVISRREAQARGLKRFYTGVTCNRSHDCERFVANGNCVDCTTFKTPQKRRGPKGANVGWPPRALVFSVPDSNVRAILPEEIEAAFLYLESMRWHDAALIEVRKNPELMKRYAKPLSKEEQAKLHAALERHNRALALARGDKL